MCGHFVFGQTPVEFHVIGHFFLYISNATTKGERSNGKDKKIKKRAKTI